MFMAKVGIVTIGRNEGQRLINALTSIKHNAPEGTPVIYVDSGSTDQSCEKARTLGAEVVHLDLSIPFTAARGRNAGFARLLELHPAIEFVQFMDGDCELVENWLENAIEAFAQHPDVVAICGWRREKYPESSPYNRVCDMEWQMGNVGEISCFGGEVMIKTTAFQQVNGYDNTVIAAEDDELSVRLRQQTQGKLMRIDHNCSLHDADIHSVFQWWKRLKRSGYAYAQVAQMHGAPPEYKFVKELKRVFLWGLIVPFVSLALAIFSQGLSLLIFFRYPLSAAMVAYRSRNKQFTWAESLFWGLSCAFSPFPGVSGALKYYLDRWRNKEYAIIEYKKA